MLILEDLYLGDVRPSERSFKRNSQYARSLDDLVKAGDALTDTLTEKQKELFEDYMTAQREVNVLTDCETFIYSFRLAAKIMIDDRRADERNLRVKANIEQRTLASVKCSLLCYYVGMIEMMKELAASISSCYTRQKP